MALPIKFGNAQPTRSGLRKGDLIVGTGVGSVPDEDYGLTSTTTYWNNINVPTDGYIVTTLGLNNSPISFAASSTSELIIIANSLGGSTTTLDEAKVYLCTRASTWLLGNTPNNTVTDDLVLALDAGSLSSSPGSGTEVMDLSGGGSNVTLVNGVSFNTNGYLEFDGVDDMGNISSLAAYSQTQAHTYEAIVKVTTHSGGYKWVLNNGGGTGGTSAIYSTNATLGILFRFFYNGGNAVVNMKDGGANKYFPFGWYHVVWRYNGNQTITFFVDGIEYDTIATAATWAATNSNPRFGAWHNGSYDAQMDLGGFKVYSKALTSTEVLQNYYQAPIITDGLVFAVDAGNLISYENGDTTIHSLIDSIDGTLTNGVGFDSNNNGSLDFDGVDDYIALTSTITNSIYTLNFWYKMGVNDGGYGYFTGVAGGKGLAISEGGTAVGLSYGNFYYFNGGAVKMTQSTLLTTGVWNNISAVIDTSAGNIKIYLNGSIITNQSVSSMSTSVSEIGRYVPANSNFINGNMASYKIYNRELSAAEVLQNYNATRTRYSEVQFITATGGTITTDGDYKVHSFTSSGTFTVTSLGDFNSVEYLIVAGGGGGGYETGGGGGAGGFIADSLSSLSVTAYPVVIGAGGARATSNNTGANGSHSSVFSIQADGGGVGGRSFRSGFPNGSNAGNDGGSGGGGKRGFNAGGLGVVGQGNDGGQGGAGSGTYVACAGGGGGAGVVGQAGGVRGTGFGGDGGDGLQIDISGTNTYYAGGGGGGSYEVANTYFGRGGNGGGGRSASGTTLAVAGTANTGGGGGGGQLNNINDVQKFWGAVGGSGIVIIRYKFQ